MALLVTLCALGAAVPTIARAGTYPVYVCSGPGVNNALAFSANTNQIQSAQWCGHSGIQVWSHGPVTGGQAGGWWFQAPSGTSITQVSANFRVSAWDGWVAHWATSENGAGDPFPGSWDCQTTDCDNYTTSDLTASVPDANLIGFAIWCHSSNCPANDSESWFGPAASDNVYDATIIVNDPSPPTFLGDQGSLTSRPAWVSAANAPSN
ncbi:MAG: hypothetical protein ACRDL5_15635, partial [Solirubrobacteraceae bacterium]